MDAVILAGGMGRRLGPLTTLFPKPLAPIGDMPIIEVLLRQLSRSGIERVSISLGHLGQLIEAYLEAKGGIPGLRIDYLREVQPLGTAGPLRMLADRRQPFLVLNGDLLTTFDFRRFVAFFEAGQAALAIAVQPRRTSVDFGVVETHPSGEVVGYVEKPVLEHLCSMGIYIYSAAAIAAIEPGEAIDAPGLIHRLLARGERVLSHQQDCYWMDIGRRDDYERAIEDFPGLRPALLGDAEPA